MASPKPSQPRPDRTSVRPPNTDPPEVVDPIWLLKAVGICLAAALVCSWLTACLLVYLGEWQLILHPTRTVDRTPASLDIPFDPIRFDAAATGQPRLTGWWIPSPSTASTIATPQSPTTILYLHDGAGSLSATLPTLQLLRASGLQIFAFDYRAFGASDASSHPTEATMSEDTTAALAYLTGIRRIPIASIVPYGAGLGASLAVALAHRQPQFPAVILDNPNPDPTQTALAAKPSSIIPVRLLFREHFDIAAPLATLTTPKLLIAGGINSANSPEEIAALQTLFRNAGHPAFTVTLAPTHFEAGYTQVVTRFLDEYLKPTATPKG